MLRGCLVAVAVLGGLWLAILGTVFLLIAQVVH